MGIGDEMISILGKYELADLKAAQNLHAMPGKGTRLLLAFLLGLFTFLVVGAVILAVQGRISWVLAIYPIFIAGFVALFWFVLRPAQIARIYRQHKELSSNFEMELTDEAYSIKNDYGSGRIPWKDFAKWKENDRMILLYRSENMFNMVPRRLLADDSQAQYVLDRLQQNGVKEASKVKNPITQITRWVLYGALVVVIILAIYLNLR
jgi:hypothetical protein